MLIYNLFPLLAGPLRQWTPHLERAAALGFDWVFVNPIQRSGESGSLYSIADYFAFDPRVLDPGSSRSGEEQVRDVVRVAEGLGLQVMVDLVVNHCAYDAELVRAHPEWFVHEHGRVAHPSCAGENGDREVWRDLARFDHQHTRDREGLFAYMMRVVNYLVGLGIHGFRCDAAYQLPRSLWEQLIDATRRKYPEIVFAAETLGCTADRTRATAQAGFDYIFNSSKWWNFSDPWLMEQYHLLRETARSISFPESHDTERLSAETGGNIAALKQRYLFAAVYSAGVMMPMGYEFGFRKRLHVVHSSPADWETTDIDLQDFIRNTNRMVTDHPIFQEEPPTETLGYDNPSILLLWKGSTRTAQEALIILNKDIHHHQHFYSDNLGRYIQAGAPLRDVSPEFRMEYLPRPFDYALRPGQGFVLVTERD
jgi:starch synthase (maltosyl-transferring)